MPLTIEERDDEVRKSTDAPSGPRPMRYSSLSLKDVVCLCAGPRDDEAWEEFVFRVQKPIALTIMRRVPEGWRLRTSLVEELVQETYYKLWKDGCRHLRDFATKHSDDDAILRYIRKTAANATRDYLKSPCNRPYVSISDNDPEPSKQASWSPERKYFRILFNEIDERLKRWLTGPDRKRDRTIFWLYFGQGMSTREIASLPTIGLTAKGAGSVIERLKHCIREQIVGFRSGSGDD